jgi:threonine/homoserine/homoserine lactone efflux protein
VTVTFLLTSFVICVSPGTGALFSIAAGVSRGGRAGVLARPHLLTRMRRVFAGCFLALGGRLAPEGR